MILKVLNNFYETNANYCYQELQWLQNTPKYLRGTGDRVATFLLYVRERHLIVFDI